MSWSWSRDQDIKTFGLKTETKTKTFFLKTETKTKTFFFKTETKTKTSKSGLETVSRPRHVSRHHITGCPPPPPSGISGYEPAWEQPR